MTRWLVRSRWGRRLWGAAAAFGLLLSLSGLSSGFTRTVTFSSGNTREPAAGTVVATSSGPAVGSSVASVSVTTE